MSARIREDVGTFFVLKIFLQLTVYNFFVPLIFFN